MAEKGDLVTDGVYLYVFEGLSEGKILLRMMDGAERVFNAAGNPMKVVPADMREEVISAMRAAEEAKRHLGDLLQGLSSV